MMFFLPPTWNINFTLDDIDESDIKVAAQPGRTDISVCTCNGFCLREAVLSSESVKSHAELFL